MKTTTSMDAVIIHTAPYKENDLLVHTYSLEYGKISLIAKGVKKLNSKNAKGVHLMSLSHLDVSLSSSLSSLIRAETVHYYRHISDDLLSEAVGEYILEYYYRYEEDNAPDETKYQMLVKCLEALNNGLPPQNVCALFQAAVIKENGLYINVDACKECDSKQVSGIDFTDGSFVCIAHMTTAKLYNKETLKYYRRVHKLSVDDLDHLDLENVEIKDIILLHNQLLLDHAGIRLNTMKFIEKLL